MKQKIRALLLVLGMLLTPVVATIVLIGTASPALAYSYNPCHTEDFYVYSGYDPNVGELYDAYDRYTVCDGGYSQYDYRWYWYY